MNETGSKDSNNQPQKFQIGVNSPDRDDHQIKETDMGINQNQVASRHQSPGHHQDQFEVSLTGKQRRTRPKRQPSFPNSLHDMLDDAEKHGFAHIVSWMPDGKSFKIHDEDAVVGVLSTYFKSTKLRSFTRQLQIYGFDRFYRGPQKGICRHEMFQRGKRHLLSRGGIDGYQISKKYPAVNRSSNTKRPSLPSNSVMNDTDVPSTRSELSQETIDRSSIFIPAPLEQNVDGKLEMLSHTLIQPITNQALPTKVSRYGSHKAAAATSMPEYLDLDWKEVASDDLKPSAHLEESSDDIKPSEHLEESSDEVGFDNLIKHLEEIDRVYDEGLFTSKERGLETRTTRTRPLAENDLLNEKEILTSDDYPDSSCESTLPSATGGNIIDSF